MTNNRNYSIIIPREITINWHHITIIINNNNNKTIQKENNRSSSSKSMSIWLGEIFGANNLSRKTDIILQPQLEYQSMFCVERSACTLFSCIDRVKLILEEYNG